jgi:hypothetical protein
MYKHDISIEKPTRPSKTDGMYREHIIMNQCHQGIQHRGNKYMCDDRFPWRWRWRQVKLWQWTLWLTRDEGKLILIYRFGHYEKLKGSFRTHCKIFVWVLQREDGNLFKKSNRLTSICQDFFFLFWGWRLWFARQNMGNFETVNCELKFISKQILEKYSKRGLKLLTVTTLMRTQRRIEKSKRRISFFQHNNVLGEKLREFLNFSWWHW